MDGKVSESVDVVSGVPQGSVLGPLLFILYTSELFHIVGNHIVGYADDRMIYTVVMESVNQNLAGINSWCFKLHMRLNLKKTKSMVVSRFQTIALGYGDLTLGGTELEEVKGLRILEVNFDFKLTFETHVRKIVSKAARNKLFVRQAGKLFDYPRVLKSCFNACVLPSLEHCAPCRCLRRSLIWVYWIV